jgi:hypothetical protein
MEPPPYSLQSRCQGDEDFIITVEILHTRPALTGSALPFLHNAGNLVTHDLASLI